MTMAKSRVPYYKQNRLKQLRAFCQVVKTGSITEAAELLFLSQPTITLQIQALERELNVTLFERSGPKITMTPPGEILYEISQPLLEGIEKLPETLMARMGSLEHGELDVAAGEATILYVLPEVTKEYAQSYPGINLRLHNETGRDGMVLLRNNEVDLIIGSLIDVPDDVIYEPVVSFDPMVIMPIGHPLEEKSKLTLKDISKYGLILPPKHLSTWRHVDFVFDKNNLKYNVTLEAGGWEVIKKYVELGLGISITTDVCLTDDDRLVKRPMNKYFPPRSYGIITRRGKFLSPAAKKYIELMKQHYNATDK